MKELTFSTHRHEIILPNTGSKFSIFPIGDVHRETSNCDEERWLNFLARLKGDITEHTLLLGTGDWNDFASWSERSKLKSMKLHESTIETLDKAALAHVTQMLGEMWFTRDHWLGTINGNHQWRFDTPVCEGIEGKTSDEYYADRLGCKNLGDLAYIRISVGFQNTGRRVNIDIVVCHGKAGGKLAGTTVNQVDDLRVIFPGADIYMMGHDHRKVALPVTSLQANTSVSEPDQLHIKQHRQWLCRSGSFLRGYVPGKQSYIVKGLLRPTDLGTIRIDCGFKTTHGSMLYKDIHVYY